MSNFCPHCDDFSIDASRASRRLVKKKNISADAKAKKIVLNVDNSDENADWIKQVRGGSLEDGSREDAEEE